MGVVDMFVREELQLANGCTEPAAVAYAVAAAAGHSQGKLQRILVEMDGFVYKNGMTTGIPGLKEYRGNKIAAAIGYYAQNNVEQKLEILADSARSNLEAAVEVLDRIDFKIVEETTPYIHVIIEADNTVESLISKHHSHLKWIKVDGQKIKDYQGDSLTGNPDNQDFAGYIKALSIADIVKLVEAEYDSEMEDILRAGLKKNMKLVAESRAGQALDIGFKYEKISDTEVAEIGSEIVHGVDARMAGVPLPVQASSGSGDQGITISIAIYKVGEMLDKDESEIFKATLIGHIVTYYVKLFTGKLSSLCGLFSAAAPGMLAGFLYLEGLTDKIEAGINNMIGDSSGIFCDGAKATCALKAVSAFELAYKHYKLIQAGLEFEESVGIVNTDLDITLTNLKKLSQPIGDTLNSSLVEIIEANHK